ncbi:MAG TPA: hypothetical protein VF314_14185 [Actinomycetes bacterium]
MNQIADEVADIRALPDPGQVRRAGDRLRVRSRRRAVVAAAGVLAVVAAAALTHPVTRATHEPIGPIDGWRVARSLDVPGSGTIVYADGALWVVDMKSGKLTADGSAPAGEMYQIDPDSGDVLDRLPGAVGGWASVGAGAIWLSTAAGDLNALTRVDLASHEVTRWSTSQPTQLPHGSGIAAGNLWVANSDSGDLIRMNPRTHQLLQTVHLGQSVKGESPTSLVTDGSSVWASTDDGVVWRVAGATGEKLSRLQLPIREARLVGIDPRRHTLYAASIRGNTLVEIDADQPGTDWHGRELSVSRAADEGMLLDVAIGPDSVWAATRNPDQLLRIDPETFRITDRMPLTGMDLESNVAVDLATGGGATWIRIKDKVLELRPQFG